MIDHIPLSAELLKSPGWRHMGINARRVVHFLMIQWMVTGGNQNGLLLAPRRQLREFGVGGGRIDKALKEVERLGVVDIVRGGGRDPNVFTLTWLPRHDGTIPEPRYLDAAAEKVPS